MIAWSVSPVLFGVVEWLVLFSNDSYYSNDSKTNSYGHDESPVSNIHCLSLMTTRVKHPVFQTPNAYPSDA